MIMIQVKNLSDDTDAARTRDLFEGYGNIAYMKMTLRGSGHRFDGAVLIGMEASAARKAIAGLDGRLVDGAILSVRETNETPQLDAGPTPAAPVVNEDPPRAHMHGRYEATEIVKTDGPGGADGDDWYRYVLARNFSRITGFHRGTLAEVTEYATACAVSFTERNLTGKAKSPFVLTRTK